MFDLPGGTIDNYESLENNLKREFIEETGLEIKVLRTLGSYDYITSTPYQDMNYTHHIALFYEVDILKKVEAVKEKIFHDHGVEINDSLGILWLNINNIDLSQCSPLLQSAINLIKDPKNTMADIEMKQWP